jgi:AcrR family transcriptional regulator
MAIEKGRAPYQSSLRARLKEQTALFILDAVAVILRQSGLAAVSIAEVARVAEVTEQTIYRHYQTRDDLVRAFVKWHLEQAVGGPDIKLPETIDEMLDWQAARYLALAKDHRIVSETYLSPVGRELRKPLYQLGYQNIIRMLNLEHPDLATERKEMLASAMLTMMSTENFILLNENLGFDHVAVHKIVVAAINAMRSGAISKG